MIPVLTGILDQLVLHVLLQFQIHRRNVRFKDWNPSDKGINGDPRLTAFSNWSAWVAIFEIEWAQKATRFNDKVSIKSRTVFISLSQLITALLRRMTSSGKRIR